MFIMISMGPFFATVRPPQICSNLLQTVSERRAFGTDWKEFGTDGSECIWNAEQDKRQPFFDISHEYESQDVYP
jgi:hypothetical protein